jgi:hypothetical protein
MSRYRDPELFTAVEDGDIPKIKRLLTRGDDINAIDGRGKGYNSLDVALQVNPTNMEAIVKLLIDRGIYVTEFALPTAERSRDTFNRWQNGAGDRIVRVLSDALAAQEPEEEDEGAEIRQREEEFDEIQRQASERVAAATSEANIGVVANAPSQGDGEENPPGAEEEPSAKPPKGGKKRKTRKAKKQSKRNTKKSGVTRKATKKNRKN